MEVRFREYLDCKGKISAVSLKYGITRLEPSCYWSCHEVYFEKLLFAAFSLEAPRLRVSLRFRLSADG